MPFEDTKGILNIEQRTRNAEGVNTALFLLFETFNAQLAIFNEHRITG